MEIDYDGINGARTIRCRTDATVWVSIQCPYCGCEWREYDRTRRGTKYTLICEKATCRRIFDMYVETD